MNRHVMHDAMRHTTPHDHDHDDNGNMTLAPRPDDEASDANALVIVCDAWNRPVKIYDDDDTDAQIGNRFLTPFHLLPYLVDRRMQSDQCRMGQSAASEMSFAVHWR